MTTTADAHATAAPTPDTVLATDLYALVVYLHKNCNSDLFEAIGALELSLTQIKLLHHLDAHPREITLKEAAETVHVSLPAASRMVDDLVRRGFAQRREDEDDRRMKRVCISDGGRTVIRRVNAARFNRLHDFTKTLTNQERRSLASALSHLTQRHDIATCRPES
jgi:DNA-binding MarR family transcriptional regulator